MCFIYNERKVSIFTASDCVANRILYFIRNGSEKFLKWQAEVVLRERRRHFDQNNYREWALWAKTCQVLQSLRHQHFHHFFLGEYLIINNLANHRNFELSIRQFVLIHISIFCLQFNNSCIFFFFILDPLYLK